MQTSKRLTLFRESVIRDMTRLALKHNAINLSQGFPDFDTPEPVKEAAVRAIQSGLNQYAITWGYPPLREKLAELYTARLGWNVHPDKHVTVTCGVSEGIITAVQSILNPGDEMLILEPAHDNFRPSAFIANAVPVSVALDAPDYRLEVAKLRAAVTPKTRAMLLNTPHNPTGRVFDQEEIAGVIEVVLENDLVLITDEIYDRILYDGRIHQSPGSLEPLKDRTITIGGLGKTFAMTGWRLGYVIAPERFAEGIRTLHDYTTICAATPLQAAAVAALAMPESFFEQTTSDYHQRRALIMEILTDVGFQASTPQGAYYIMADYSQLPIPQASLAPTEFAYFMASDVGVAVVPGDSFYSLEGYGRSTIRFAFPKKISTLEQAGERLLARLK
ncbi:MAG: aminotransferase class I/II-fold pyridoxal phosphate-dependent enzyme [Anaerolineaceae bacterium]|nr:aminotransferase class I/II-fold pyridoxal phosphate-dependent enzyme [Anaerolineaceae bacterium]